MKMTIRTRFAVLAGSLVLIVVAAIGLGAYVVAGQQLRNQVDGTLNARATLIARSLERNGRPDFSNDDRVPRRVIDTFLQTEFDAVTQYIDSEGVIVASAGSVNIPLSSSDAILSNRARGYRRSTVTVEVSSVSSADGCPSRRLTHQGCEEHSGN